MQTIQTYQQVAGLGADEFIKLHPHPFLVHAGGRLRSLDRDKTRGLTVDRIMVESTPPQQQHVASSFLIAELVPRDPANLGPITVGVSSSCDVQINDQSLSKQHAWFDRGDDTWRVWDNDSVAGTQVNDTPVRPGVPHPLIAGDRITFGYVDVTFLPPAAFHRLIGGLLR